MSEQAPDRACRLVLNAQADTRAAMVAILRMAAQLIEDGSPMDCFSHSYGGFTAEYAESDHPTHAEYVEQWNAAAHTAGAAATIRKLAVSEFLADDKTVVHTGAALTQEAAASLWEYLSGQVDAEHEKPESEGALSARGWRPIETAPKDGTLILAFGPLSNQYGATETWSAYGDPIVCISSYDRSCSRLGFWPIEHDGDHGYVKPTHWAPLPGHPNKS